MITDDLELLARYARHGAEDAFEALVRRHSDLVYSVALRIVRSPQLAEEVAQSVFIELSQHAKRMNAGVILSAWLYRVTRSKAVDVVRRESRRQRREQTAAALDFNVSTAPEADIEPLLDDALDSLTETDRAAVVLRFLERKSMSDVGGALGVSDDAAQKRVSRAVDQLRAFFAKRGFAVGAAGVAAMLTANALKAAPIGLAAGICAGVKASASTVTTTTLIQTIVMTTTQKFLVATVVAIAAGFTIYQASHESDTPQAQSSRQSAGSSDSATPPARVRANGQPAGSGPRYLLQPRLDEAGKRHLQHDPGTLLTKKSDEGWTRADDDLLVAWAAMDPEAAMKWVDSGERAPVRAQLLGAVAAGILLRDGKDAMRRFLDEHQQDPGLLPKHQGALDTYLFYHLGREDTFGAAMEILSGSDDGSLAGAMISSIDGAQYQTKAIDYMEAKGIPVDMDYWKHQEAIAKDPRFWADWALQRDSSLIGDIVDGWARDQPAEAKAWVEERVSKNDKHRKEIDERLQLRANPPE